MSHRWLRPTEHFAKELNALLMDGGDQDSPVLLVLVSLIQVSMEILRQIKDILKVLGWTWRHGRGDSTFKMVNKNSNLKRES